MGNPFTEPMTWARVTISGVSFPAHIVDAPAPGPLGRWGGAVRVTFTITRAAYPRFLAMFRPHLRRAYIRRHVAAHALSRTRHRS